jgi:uncharacterized protein YlxW (UPF0749 family)
MFNNMMDEMASKDGGGDKNRHESINIYRQCVDLRENYKEIEKEMNQWNRIVKECRVKMNERKQTEIDRRIQNSSKC